jgi:RNA polymerase sigma factor (sigma-70 family)
MQAGADQTLIEASRGGDRTAFAQIIERYQRAVYAVAYSGVRDRALADDVTQDTFVIAWRRLGELRDDQRLAAWLCGIARNRARDVRRQTWRETAGEVDVSVAHSTTPFDELSEVESEQIVATALGQVPDVYREPLVLYYYEERSVDDVARSLGISPATTNKRLSRGRQYLADCVATVERGLLRRGPSPGLAGAVLAVIGVAASASHVDASPVAKGSTMHKLAIAAVVTATVGGTGALVISTARNDAHAGPRTTSSSSGVADTAHASVHASHQASSGPSLCDIAESLKRHTPSLAAADSSGTASTADANDCAAVGRHLSELEADTTHGPNVRPDEATCEKCASHYAAMCESQAWSVERRTCTLAAADLINAHLCGGSGATTSTAPQPPSAVPPQLSCKTISSHLAATVQGAGLHADVTDMPDQIEAACELGGWSLELRSCFAAASTVDGLKSCFMPDADEALREFKPSGK